MAKGRKTGGGSRTGRPNKTTQAMREAFEATFAILQESPGEPYALATWAKQNPTEFYKLSAKLIPAQLEIGRPGDFDNMSDHDLAAIVRDISREAGVRRARSLGAEEAPEPESLH